MKVDSINEIITICKKHSLGITIGEYGVTFRKYCPDKHWVFSRLYNRELFDNTNADMFMENIISSFIEEANRKYEKDFRVVINNVEHNKGS